MTPLQFAQQECANHQNDGTCLGVVIADDLSLHLSDSSFSIHPSAFAKCIVATGHRCPYFEECVAPLADMVSDPRRVVALQKAVAEYRKITKQGEDLTRQCPDCGGPMSKGKKVCPLCADKRRKATYRQYHHQKRKTRVSLPQMFENTPQKH